MLTGLALGGLSDWPEEGVCDAADGVESGLSCDAGGACGGPVAGMDAWAPLRAEAAGDLSEHDGGPDLPRGDVVGCADAPVLEKDEELGPPRLHLGLEGASGGMGRGRGEQPVEPTVDLGPVLPQGAVPRLVAPSADGDRPGQQPRQRRREHGVATVDGVPHVAQHMGQADLMCGGHLLLAGVAVGNPDGGLVPAHHRFGHRPRTARGDLVQHRLGGDEHPMPVRPAIDPGGGFIRPHDSGGAELRADRRALGLQRRLQPVQGIGDGAFGRWSTRTVRRRAGPPLEPDVVAVVGTGWIPTRSATHRPEPDFDVLPAPTGTPRQGIGTRGVYAGSG